MRAVLAPGGTCVLRPGLRKQWETAKDMRKRQIIFTLAVSFVLTQAFVGCGDLAEGSKGQLEFLVNNTEGATTVPLSDANATTLIAPKTYPMRLLNVGSAAVNITSIAFLPNNADGTPLNPYLTLDWPGAFTAGNFPLEVRADGGDFEFTIAYAPKCENGICTAGGNGTLVIES
ncbi:MAG: hypothetical protein ACI9OJ_004596, partial [Myxococcota bacterium]